MGAISLGVVIVVVVLVLGLVVFFAARRASREAGPWREKERD